MANRSNYTNKDYQSILQELISTSPELSKAYEPQSENDPAAFLLKNMALLGDMLSFYLDKQSLECHPSTMTQRKIANAYYRMFNYYMSWWRPAQCTLTIRNNNDYAILLPKYTSFESISSGLRVTTIEDQVLRANDNTEVVVYEGVYGIDGSRRADQGSLSIINNEYVLSTSAQKCMVESITVVANNDNQSTQWNRVDDIDKYSSYGRYFDFMVNDYDKPYLRFSSYLQIVTDRITGVEYIYSVGEGTNLTSNDFIGAIIRSRNSKSLEFNAEIPLQVVASTSSTQSTQGYETPSEAYINAQKYINTSDTLITPTDYQNAIRRVEGVSSCIVTDKQTETRNPTDLKSADGSDAQFTQFDYIIRYITNNHDYSRNLDSDILSSLDGYSALKLDGKFTNDMFIHTWQPRGTITLRESVSMSEAESILKKVCRGLCNDYHPNKMNFGEPVSLVSLVEKVMSYDNRIMLVDFKPIEYEISNPSQRSETNSNGYPYQDLANIFEAYVNGTALAPDVPGDSSKRHWQAYNSATFKSSSGYKLSSYSIVPDSCLGTLINELNKKSYNDDKSGVSTIINTLLDPFDFFNQYHPWKKYSITRFANYQYLSNIEAESDNAFMVFKMNVSINKENVQQ